MAILMGNFQSNNSEKRQNVQYVYDTVGGALDTLAVSSAEG